MTDRWNRQQNERNVLAAIRAGLQEAKQRPPWAPLPHQVPPPGDWRGWLLLGGRFAGKTDAGASYMCDHVKGPPCFPGSPMPHLMGIVAPVLADAARSCYYGPSGIRAHAPGTKLISTVGGTQVRFPDGSVANIFGTDTEAATDRLRSGGNTCLVWAEEIAAWRWLDLAWAHMRLGLRSGPHPRWVGTTTPKPRQLIKDLNGGVKYRNVVVTHATSRENPYVPEDVLADLLADYGGTSLAEQEIEGRIVDQDQNALWRRDQLAKYRLTLEQAPLAIMQRIIVGVDPSGGAGEQGIVVVGFSDTPLFHPEHTTGVPRGFVLADYTCTLSPEGWGRRAITAAIDFDATEIVFESDYGRDMPASVLSGAAEQEGLAIPIRPALARTIGSKRTRAYPVAQRATQGRYPHVGTFEELEDQMCTWTEESNYSPDRIDAAVWPAWRAGLVSTTFKGTGSIGGSAMAGRSLTRRDR